MKKISKNNYICSIGREGKCKGSQVSCPHMVPHKRQETCKKMICTMTTQTDKYKPECEEV